MLRTKTPSPFIFGLILITFATFWLRGGESATTLRRLTSTSEEIINLNPSLSGDGHLLVFESSADLSHTGNGQGFHAVRAQLQNEPATLSEIAKTRIVAAAMSQDGAVIAFNSTEDLVGQNNDHNSEIYLQTATNLRQITDTQPETLSRRILDGCFQPSITDDGGFMVFASNRNLGGLNADLNSEIFLFEIATRTFTQVTDSNGVIGATDAKISGDGSKILFIRDNNEIPDVGRDLLLYDRTTHTTKIIANHLSTLALAHGRAISDNGLRVVYSGEIAEHQSQIFLFDASNGISRQITALGTRISEVPLNATISGDGRRIAFATRRKVIAASDGSVELYAYDIPTSQFIQLTDAPSNATAEVVSSLNDDGSLVAFNFPRVLSGGVSSNDTVNNCEIYIADVPSRPAFFTLTVANGASRGNEPGLPHVMPRGGIVEATGAALATATITAQKLETGSFPLSLTGTTVTVNGLEAQMLYASPTQVQFLIPNETSAGSAEIVITNSEGFQSRSTISISNAAPGIFTRGGDGKGEAIILDADTFVTRPFDPSTGRLRLVVFATGVRNANNVAITIAGRIATVEAVLASTDLPGLDEIHLLVPADLRGVGRVNFSVMADDRESNTVTLSLGGSSLRDIVINEVLADPPDGLEGDANHDGTRGSSEDEFVELVNSTSRDLDLTGYQLQTRALSGTTDIVRHRFSSRTIFPAGTAIIIFGGGNFNISHPAFAGALVSRASTGSLSLTNSGGVVTLRDSSGSEVTFVTYGSAVGLPGDSNQSLTRFPDVIGTFVPHQLAPGGEGRAFSPGTHVDGAPFSPAPAISHITVSPVSATLLLGQQQQFSAQAFDENSQQLTEVIFNWESSDSAIVTIDSNGVAVPIKSGIAMIVASARNRRSSPSILSISQPSPSPTPTVVPSPSPSPNPSPTGTPSPTPAPTPSPSPTPLPGVVISEFRTRGPNGASDEFIELYNNSDLPILIGGWKIKSSSNAGLVTTRATINDGTTIPARGHFLVTNSSGYSGSVSGNQTYSSGIADDGGIGVVTAVDLILDEVGMSVGSAFKEGTLLSPLSGTENQSYERKPGGTLGSGQDTSNNAADFQLITPSDPQNLASNLTPGPSPGPTPSPSPSPSPDPSVSPSPSPSASVSPSPSPSPSPTAKVVISQIYGGGGNSGAPFRNDFIEIFNSGNVPVDLSGWSVQYASATSSSWSVTNLTSLALAPGQYNLIQQASGGTTGQSLPAPDTTGTINLSSTAGKVALVNSAAPLASVCPASSDIIDFVGYGSTTNCAEGSVPAAALSNNIAIQRGGNGCSDTQNNANDFATATPNPRNTATVLNTCASASSFGKTRPGPSRDLFWWLCETLLLVRKLA